MMPRGNPRGCRTPRNADVSGGSRSLRQRLQARKIASAQDWFARSLQLRLTALARKAPQVLPPVHGGQEMEDLQSPVKDCPGRVGVVLAAPRAAFPAWGCYEQRASRSSDWDRCDRSIGCRTRSWAVGVVERKVSPFHHRSLQPSRGTCRHTPARQPRSSVANVFIAGTNMLVLTRFSSNLRQRTGPVVLRNHATLDWMAMRSPPSSISFIADHHGRS
jgi:hypothetical protein